MGGQVGGLRSGSSKPWWEVSVGKTGGRGGLHLPRVSKLLWGFSRIKIKAFSCPWEALADPGARCLGVGGRPLSSAPAGLPAAVWPRAHSLSLNCEPPAGLWMLPSSTEVHAGRIQTGARRKWGALQGPEGLWPPLPRAQRSLQGPPGRWSSLSLPRSGWEDGRLMDPQACCPLGPSLPLLPHTQAVPW